MENIIKALEAIVAEAEAMKGAYFFTPPTCAGARRSYERKHSHELVEWEEGGHSWSAEYTVSCSCKNVYAYPSYTKDGKKTTLVAVRNSLKRMKASIDQAM